MNKIETNDFLTLKNGDKYIVIDSLSYNNKYYAFADSVSDDENEVLGMYKVLCITDGGVYAVTDDNLLNNLLPIFSSRVQKIIEGNGLLG